MEQNPYQPPSSEITNPDILNPDAEAIRNEHLKHETNVKSIGTLYYLGGIGMGLGFIGMLIDGGKPSDGTQMPYVALLAFIGVFAFITFGLGYGLTNLKPWARIPTLILAAIGLAGFPIGTIINLYVLYLVGGKKGKMVFSPEYQQVIALTPHIKYKSPWKTCLILLIVLIAFIAAMVYFMSRK